MVLLQGALGTKRVLSPASLVTEDRRERGERTQIMENQQSTIEKNINDQRYGTRLLSPGEHSVREWSRPRGIITRSPHYLSHVCFILFLCFCIFSIFSFPPSLTFFAAFHFLTFLPSIPKNCRLLPYSFQISPYFFHIYYFSHISRVFHLSSRSSMEYLLPCSFHVLPCYQAR